MSTSVRQVAEQVFEDISKRVPKIDPINAPEIQKPRREEQNKREDAEIDKRNKDREIIHKQTGKPQRTE